MPALSSGERIMLEVALAFYNGHAMARFSDFFLVDRENQQRIVEALEWYLSGR